MMVQTFLLLDHSELADSNNGVQEEQEDQEQAQGGHTRQRLNKSLEDDLQLLSSFHDSEHSSDSKRPQNCRLDTQVNTNVHPGDSEYNRCANDNSQIENVP